MLAYLHSKFRLQGTSLLTPYVGGLMVLAFALPFSRALMSLATVAVVILALTTGSWAEKWQRLRKQPVSWGLMGLYLLYVLGLIHSDNMAQAAHRLWEMFPLWALALGIGLGPILSAAQVRLILRSFIAGTVITCLLCLLLAAYDIIWVGAVDHPFSYTSLSYRMAIHPAFLSFFVSLSFFAWLWLWDQARRTGGPSRNLATLLGCGFLLMMLIMLSARMQLLAFSLIVLLGILYEAHQRRQLWRGLALILGFTIIVGGLLSIQSQSRKRMVELVSDPAPDDHAWTGRTVRMHIWPLAWELILQKPWIGQGTGDAITALMQVYAEHDFEYGVKNRLNAHNQFLDTTLVIGGLGLLYLLGLMSYLFGWAWKQEQGLLLVFMGLFFLSCLTECMLNRQWGLTTFAFFSVLLMHPRVGIIPGSPVKKGSRPG